MLCAKHRMLILDRSVYSEKEDTIMKPVRLFGVGPLPTPKRIVMHTSKLSVVVPIVVILLALLSPTPALGQCIVSPGANGCTLNNIGNFPGRQAVQDLLDAVLFGACDRHDGCYRDCFLPVALTFDLHRATCDLTLLLELQTWCGAVSGLQAIADLGISPAEFEAGCAGAMLGVYGAVRIFGEGNYACDQCELCTFFNNACCYFGLPGCPFNCDPDGIKEFLCIDQSGVWDASTCTCNTVSPIILNLEEPQIRLTDAGGGVDFDINGDGRTERIAWTTLDSGAAFLALDRNGNGKIDDGTELFGNFTMQPPAASPNGFAALAIFDLPQLGGDANGRITEADAIFTRLKLWIDSNHDGESQDAELTSLSSFGIVSIDLDFRESRRQDQYGNEFRYRSKVHFLNNQQRFAYDVFLTVSR